MSQPALNFSGVSDDSLAGLRGHWAVLYFYPKADSYGCSIEAQKFEASLPEFERLGAKVIGISTDSAGGQAAFREKRHLSFPLRPDPDQRICKAYGVMGGVTGLLGVSGRVAVVTGANSGLGFETAKALAASGAAVSRARCTGLEKRARTSAKLGSCRAQAANASA